MRKLKWYKYWTERATEFDLGAGFKIVKQTISNEELFCIKNDKGYTLRKDGKWEQWFNVGNYPPEPSFIRDTTFEKLYEAFEFFVQYIESEAR